MRNMFFLLYTIVLYLGYAIKYTPFIWILHLHGIKFYWFTVQNYMFAPAQCNHGKYE